jgi:hypothetical protein
VASRPNPASGEPRQGPGSIVEKIISGRKSRRSPARHPTRVGPPDILRWALVRVFVLHPVSAKLTPIEPYEFTGFGAIGSHKLHRFIGFGGPYGQGRTNNCRQLWPEEGGRTQKVQPLPALRYATALPGRKSDFRSRCRPDSEFGKHQHRHSGRPSAGQRADRNPGHRFPARLRNRGHDLRNLIARVKRTLPDDHTGILLAYKHTKPRRTTATVSRDKPR